MEHKIKFAQVFFLDLSPEKGTYVSSKGQIPSEVKITQHFSLRSPKT